MIDGPSYSHTKLSNTESMPSTSQISKINHIIAENGPISPRKDFYMKRFSAQNEKLASCDKVELASIDLCMASKVYRAKRHYTHAESGEVLYLREKVHPPSLQYGMRVTMCESQSVHERARHR